MKQLLWWSSFCIRIALSGVCSSYTAVAVAQDLVPGAYTPAPIGFNLVNVSGVFNQGDLAFDPTLPIEEGHSTIGWSALSYGRTLNIAGHYANIGVGVPYVIGHLEGLLSGQFAETSRSGFGDVSARFGLNLYGAPAMTLKQFAAFRPTTIVGVSVAVGIPIGQYDSDLYINIGTNRWYVKPELGFSRTRGRWTFEGDLGASFFTDNSNYVGGAIREQAPIVSLQGHLIYAIRPGYWVAGDGNFWQGGRVTTNGAPQLAQQKNSRLGATVAVPVARQQVRIAYSFGAYTTIGGDYQTIGVSYSYAWAGRP